MNLPQGDDTGDSSRHRPSAEPRRLSLAFRRASTATSIGAACVGRRSRRELSGQACDSCCSSKRSSKEHKRRPLVMERLPLSFPGPGTGSLLPPSRPELRQATCPLIIRAPWRERHAGARRVQGWWRAVSRASRVVSGTGWRMSPSSPRSVVHPFREAQLPRGGPAGSGFPPVQLRPRKPAPPPPVDSRGKAV